MCEVKLTATQVDIKRRNIELMAIRLVHESLGANPNALMNLSAKNEITKSISKTVELNLHMYEMLCECRDFIASDNNAGPQGLGLICMIDDLLAEARGEYV